MSSMQKILETLIFFSWSEQPIRAGCLVLLIILSLSFLIFYLFPAAQWWWRIRKAIRALKKIQKEGPITDLNILETDFFSHQTMTHLWREYGHTLHPEKDADATGQQRVVRYRATVPAEAFFSQQALVDSQLHADFFKHLPGIFTGTGIIGTFLGLIQGLNGFTISEDTKIVQGSLEGLMKGVSEAFTISFLAIFLAMICTFFEKVIYMVLVKQVEELCSLIDSLFDAGAGEEYLARLVKASEESKTHLAHLKDSLVGDLKQILSDVSRQQIEAIQQAASTQEMATKDSGKAITSDLADQLKSHLDRFVDRSTDNQGAAVQKILADLIAGFTAKIDDTFGGQMRGLNELLSNTTAQVAGLVQQLKDEARNSSGQHEDRQKELQNQMNNVVNGLAERIGSLVSTVNSLSGNLKDAGKGAADALSEQLEKAVFGMKSNQEEMNRQMKEFVQQIKELVSSSQSETNQRLQETLSTLGAKVSSMIEDLKRQTIDAANGHKAREEKFQETTSGAVQDISGQVDKLMTDIARSTTEMQATITKLGEVSLGSINRMESAAETISIAADDFSKAGNGMTGILGQVGTVSSEINLATGGLAGASSNINAAANAYQMTNQQMAGMLQSLNEIVENARREASMTKEQIVQIRAAAEALGGAEQEAEAYLEQVGEVLISAHQKFADNIERTLASGNAEFHKQLSTATKNLSYAIQELTATLDTIPQPRN